MDKGHFRYSSQTSKQSRAVSSLLACTPDSRHNAEPFVYLFPLQMLCSYTAPYPPVYLPFLVSILSRCPSARTAVLRSFVFIHIACAEQYIPQRCGNTKIGVGVIVMDMMIGRPVSGKSLLKTVVVDGEMAQPIDGIA